MMCCNTTTRPSNQSNPTLWPNRTHIGSYGCMLMDLSNDCSYPIILPLDYLCAWARLHISTWWTLETPHSLSLICSLACRSSGWSNWSSASFSLQLAPHWNESVTPTQTMVEQKCTVIWLLSVISFSWWFWSVDNHHLAGVAVTDGQIPGLSRRPSKSWIFSPDCKMFRSAKKRFWIRPWSDGWPYWLDV